MIYRSDASYPRQMPYGDYSNNTSKPLKDFVFDEPTIGLHPLDVETLLKVFNSLIDNGATVIVIEHDLDVIRNSNYVIDMGPGSGVHGGRIVAKGTPEEISRDEDSKTGYYLKKQL